MAVDLATARLHLRIDGDDEDALVGLYLQAAKDHAAQFLNRAIYADEAALAEAVLAGDTTGIVATGAMDAAVLLMCGALYANREQEIAGTTSTELKFGARSLLEPYRLLVGV